MRKLEAELDITGVVCVDSEYLCFGSPLKFPDYDICRDELDSIANGSHFAKIALEAGDVRLSEIPEELMAEDADEERANWFGDRLSDPLKDQVKKIKALEGRMKALEKEIKEKDDKIKEMVRAETYPEGVSEKEYLMEVGEVWKKQKESREELSHLKEKHKEELSRLKTIIAEEENRSTSLNDTITYPEGDSKGIEEADSQKTNSNIEKGGNDQ